MNYEKLQEKYNLANCLMGVGLLLVIVPVGVCLMSLLVSGNLFSEAQLLGWLFYLVVLLLPVGGIFCSTSFYWMARIKQEMIALEEEEEERMAAKHSSSSSKPPNLTPPTQEK